MRQPKIKRYYVLRLIGVVYKLFSILTVIASIVVTIWAGMDIAYGNHPDKYQYPFTFVALALVCGLIIGGGLLALTFAVFGQLIDLLIEMNENMRIVAARQEKSTRSLNPPRESVNVPVTIE
jgi:hypothetical protein